MKDLTSCSVHMWASKLCCFSWLQEEASYIYSRMTARGNHVIPETLTRQQCCILRLGIKSVLHQPVILLIVDSAKGPTHSSITISEVDVYPAPSSLSC